MSIINDPWYGSKRPPHIFLKPTENNFKVVGHSFKNKEMFVINNTNGIVRNDSETEPRYFKMSDDGELEYELKKEQINTVQWEPRRIGYNPIKDVVYELFGENNYIPIEYEGHDELRKKWSNIPKYNNNSAQNQEDTP